MLRVEKHPALRLSLQLVPSDTIFNYSLLCHCLRSFQLLLQNAARISLAASPLAMQPIIYADWATQSAGADRHLPLAICWQQRNVEPYKQRCSLKIWKRTQLAHDWQFLLGLYRVLSIFVSWVLDHSVFLPRCFCGHHPSWLCPSDPSPHANTFLHPRSPPAPTMMLLPLLTLQHLQPQPLYSSVGKPGPFSSPSLLRHTHSRPCLSRAGRKSTASSFILETNRRDISAALSWNVPGGDGIFRCQNSTSLCRACTNCKGINAYTWSRLGCHLPNVLKSKFQLFGWLLLPNVCSLLPCMEVKHLLKEMFEGIWLTIDKITYFPLTLLLNADALS